MIIYLIPFLRCAGGIAVATNYVGNKLSYTILIPSCILLVSALRVLLTSLLTSINYSRCAFNAAMFSSCHLSFSFISSRRYSFNLCYLSVFSANSIAFKLLNSCRIRKVLSISSFRLARFC